MMDTQHEDSLLSQIELEPDIRFGPQTPVPETSTPDLDGIDYFHLLWDRRSWLSKVLVSALVMSTVVVFFVPKEYESTISILAPDSMGGNSLPMLASAAKVDPSLAAMATNIFGMKSNGAYFVALLNSRTVEDHVIQKCQLQRVYSARYLQDARKKLASRTGISEDRKSGVISLSVRDHDPQRARDIAQAYVDELNRLVSTVSVSSARRERIFIEQRLASAKSDLADAEEKFSSFASKNAALDIKEQAKAMVESAAQLQGHLIAAQSELQGLEEIYAPNHVRVRSARARVEELQHELQRMGGTQSTGHVRDKSDEIYPSIRELPLLGVDWADLYRRVKIQETVYELLNQQYELARIQEAKEIPTVNVIDPPNVPEKKSWPPRLLLILASTSMALAGAGGWILGCAHWARVSPDEPRKQMWLTLSAAIRGHLRSGTGLLHRLRSRQSKAA